MDKVTIGSFPKHSVSMKESLRILKTNIQFCGDDKKVILITSTLPNEGKSTISMSLAKSLSSSGKKVLFIDTDMRKSNILEQYQIKNVELGNGIYGLSHYLSGQKKPVDILYRTDSENFYMILAGPNVPNATELLENEYFGSLIKASRNMFDYVVVDCAPIGVVIDSAIVAKHCDGAVMVVSQGMAKTRAIKHAIHQLRASGIPILGAVLNKVKRNKNSYGYGYGYGYGDKK